MNPSRDFANLPVCLPPSAVPGFFVYMLLCADGTLYVGATNDVARRVRQHQSRRGAKHTNDNEVVRLVFVEGPFNQATALARERQLKGWIRVKKTALILGRGDILRALSKSRDV
jgi:putative endonuclease